MATTHPIRSVSSGIPEIDALLEFLSRTLVTMTQANDEDEALASLAELVADTRLVERMSISLVEDDPATLRVIVLVEDGKDKYADTDHDLKPIHIVRARSLTDVALSSNLAMSWNPADPLDRDSLSDGSWNSAQHFQSLGLVSGVCVPLRSGRIEIGCLQIYGRDPEGFSPNFLASLTRLGEIIGMAIDKARLMSQLRGELVDAATANARLEASNRDLEEFAHVASHDLQEPLRKIRAFGGRLEAKASERLTEQEMSYLQRMQSSADRMQTLINDLLHFSRCNTATTNPQQLQLNTVVADVLADLEMAIEESGAAVEASSLPSIVADPSQMRQLMQNLVANAVKFRNTDVAPIIRIGSRTDDDGNLSIFVADNGIGFDEKYMDKIFKPFQRLHARHDYGGSGIGLSVCRRIAERHGGVLTASSQPGLGSTFTLHLAATQPEETNSAIHRPLSM